MSTITTRDGTRIFYKDWGPRDAQAIVFHHGWPLSADDWTTRCSTSSPKGIGLLHMTVVVTAARLRQRPGTIWIPTRPTWRH